MTTSEPTALEELATLRKERSNLRARAESYKDEIERAAKLMRNALHRTGGVRRDDTLPAADGWPSCKDLPHTWGELVVMVEKIRDLQRDPRERGALQP